uniref:Retrovirus-related Pol polyprotein from transposon TNT 1-94-like beta-barrel domain-containing protein n=1 Tax=Cannabis sativa TaxID=3483 RepID=A0A803NR82_CANSA
MVSEPWPPLLANMATICPRNSSSQAVQQGAPIPAPRNRTRDQEDANIAHTTRDQDDNWYPDSRATNHCIPNGQNIMTQTDYEGPKQLYVGNGAASPISQIGNTNLHPNTCHKPSILNNLLYVPKVTKNLLSVSKFATDNDVYFVFYPDVCYVKGQVSNSTLLTGRHYNGLYTFDSSQL